MCSYCGCEAEPLVTSLMEDHAAIADLVYRVKQSADTGNAAGVRTLMAELSERFRAHSLKEENGLFAELTDAGEAIDEVGRLLADHQRLRPLLSSPELPDEPERLQAALADLTEHAETEDNDLFPYALQFLPARSWDRINAVAG